MKQMTRIDEWGGYHSPNVCFGGGGSSPPASQTITQVQQIPQYQQDFSQGNQNIAASIASQPYPVYNGQLVAPFSDQQQQAFNQTSAAASPGAYQPQLGASQGLLGAAAGSTMGATQPWNAQTAGQYMSPYAMDALAPQLQMADINQQQNALKIGQQATQAGAFGDARQGVAEGLNNFYGGLTKADIVGQGMNQAYNTGLSAFQTANAQQLQAGNQLGNFSTAEANLGGLNQQLGLNGANALYQSGTNQQALGQEQLNSAYQQFLNQQNWPQQMLNTRLSALSNSPYNLTSYQTLPPANTTAQNLGAFGALAGGLGSLAGGGTTAKA